MLTHLFESRGKDTVKEKTTTTKVVSLTQDTVFELAGPAWIVYNFQPPAVGNENAD